MVSRDFKFISESKNIPAISPAKLDQMLSQGWRHFGEYFFRYNLNWGAVGPYLVIPLRIDLAQFVPSGSQAKIVRKNADLHTVIRPIEIDAAKLALFDKHKERFTSNIPDSIYTFLSTQPDQVPCQAMAVEVHSPTGQLLACSFMDIGQASVSSVYGMFDPDYGGRSLGIYTMLLEIGWALAQGKEYYYHGYCYSIPSHYDYKKKFSGLQMYDWQENWSAKPPNFGQF
jgi:leucyl-tRNA---protein transferase